MKKGNRNIIGVVLELLTSRIVWIALGMAALLWVTDYGLEHLITFPGLHRVVDHLLVTLMLIAFSVGVALTTSRHKQAEAQLRENEERYRSVVEHSLNGILIVDDTHQFIYANDELCRILGYSREEIIGHDFRIFVAEESQPLLADRYRRRQKGEDVPSRYEFTGIRKGGEKRQFEISSAVMRDSAGKLRTVAQLLDITERKRMEDELRESEAKYRTLVATLPEGVYQSNLAGEFITMNQVGAKILGFDSADQVVGKHKTVDFFVDPRDNETMIDVMKRTGSWRGEVQAKTADGRQSWLSINASARTNGQGEIVGWEGVFGDITARKRQETELLMLRKAVETSAEAVFLTDAEGTITFVNPEFTRLYGYSPAEVVGKTTPRILKSGKMKPADCQRFWQTILKKKVVKGEIINKHQDGRLLDIESSVSPILADDGNIIGFLAIQRDISARKRMEEQLLITDRLASIGELASGVAHELNNPLTSVIGFSRLLLDRDLPDGVREDVKIISNGAERASRIVKNLLTFARKHPEARQPVDINEAIEAVLGLRAYEQKVNNIQVVKHFSTDLVPVVADGFQLQQVFTNLVINAEYFMLEAHTKGTLTITTVKVGDIIKVSFADDGPGIPKEHLARLFSPFFTTKPVGKGTGLGLSICHGIITSHGGRIYAESGTGKGATFIIELPLK